MVLMDENYTRNIELDLVDLAYDLEESDNYETIIEFLKGEKFRSFGDSLVWLIKKNDKNADVTDSTLKKYLEEKCKKNGVDLEKIGNRNTFKNWFGNTYPDKTAENREKMFAIAFALELNVEEVKYLFHKVYFDRAFDYRNYKESVYYYCILKGYNYERANRMIKVIEEREDKTSIEKIDSLSIAKKISDIKNDDELIDWICSRWSEFQCDNKAAMENYEILFGKVRELAKEEYSIDIELKEEEKKKKEEKAKKKRKKINIHKKSVKFVYYVLFKYFPKPNEEKKYISIIKKGTNIHKEIKTNFPQTNTISGFCNKNSTKFENREYEKLRKIIVLFYFYWFYSNALKKINNIIDSVEKGNAVRDYKDKFIVEINDILNECGMCELYIGNTYDFLFLLCAESETAIYTLRQIMLELRGEKNE